MAMRRLCWVTIGIGATSAAAIAADWVEVSKDGRTSVNLSLIAAIPTAAPSVEPAPGAGLDARGAPSRGDVMSRGAPTVPYNLTPDWANTLRRQVSGLKIADMNGDGRNDLVVGCYSSNSFPPYTDWENMIYYNDGDGLEASPSWVSSDEVSTIDVQVADINRDGFPDIFSANGAGAASVIYFGSATGPSTSPGWVATVPGNTFTVSAAVFDVDHDNDLDVFTGNQGFSSGDAFRPMYGFRNNNGVLESTPFWQSAETSIQNTLSVGDYDGDGWEDLAVSKWVNFQSGVYRNLGGVMQTTPAWTTGETTADRGTDWADVDGDGDLDLALGRSATSWYRNHSGVLSFEAALTAPFWSHSELVFADVNGDGWPDLAETHFSDGRTHIYLNNEGVLGPAPAWTYDAGPLGTAIALGDLNGDTWIDFAIGYSGDPSVVVFFANPPLLPGDMNCDGVVSVGDIAGFVLALTDPAAYAATYPACDINNADVNGDGAVSVGDIGPFVTLLAG